LPRWVARRPEQLHSEFQPRRTRCRGAAGRNVAFSQKMPILGPSRVGRFLREHKAPRRRCRLVGQPLPRATCCTCLVCGLLSCAAAVAVPPRNFCPSPTRRNVSQPHAHPVPGASVRARARLMATAQCVQCELKCARRLGRSSLPTPPKWVYSAAGSVVPSPLHFSPTSRRRLQPSHLRRHCRWPPLQNNGSPQRHPAKGTARRAARH
jgi:hypothetical protein